MVFRMKIQRAIASAIAIISILLYITGPVVAKTIDNQESSDQAKDIGVDRYEANYRKAVVKNTVDFHKKMMNGKISFGRFMELQYYNPQYWQMVHLDGRQYWKVRNDVRVSDAMRDVFDPFGGYYSFDCSAAINLIVIKSKMDVIGENNFNRYFNNMMVKGWEVYIQPFGQVWKPYKAIEHHSGNIYTMGTIDGLKVGDFVYFKHPFIPEGMSAEQGENALYLGKDVDGHPVFFGLNIGYSKGEICEYGYLSSLRGTVDMQRLKELAEM